MFFQILPGDGEIRGKREIVTEMRAIVLINESHCDIIENVST